MPKTEVGYRIPSSTNHCQKHINFTTWFISLFQYIDILWWFVHDTVMLEKNLVRSTSYPNILSSVEMKVLSK